MTIIETSNTSPDIRHGSIFVPEHFDNTNHSWNHLLWFETFTSVPLFSSLDQIKLLRTFNQPQVALTKYINGRIKKYKLDNEVAKFVRLMVVMDATKRTTYANLESRKTIKKWVDDGRQPFFRAQGEW